MTRLTSGLTIRPARLADAAGIARVHVASWRMAYRGVIADATLDSLSESKRAAMWAQRLKTLAVDPALREESLFVASDTGDDVVGFARGGRARPLSSGDLPARYDGELYEIYMGPGFERRGVGRRLAGAVARRLAADGLRSVLLWALADNPYRRFYEALGGTPAFEQEITIEGQSLKEIGYGWPDIQTLIARTAPVDGNAG